MPPAAEMERAYRQRDASYDGLFVFGVRTTGIFCRPTCAARKPLPQNVEYFPHAAAAEAAGYRPCKRCRPLASDERPAWVQRLLKAVERRVAGRIGDAELKTYGVDPATARRYFLRHYGMTFQAYARAQRLARSLGRLRDGARLDAAIDVSGYESHSGFRDAFNRAFGVAPGRARRSDCVLLTWLPGPIGPMLAGATATGVCLLAFTTPGLLKAQVAAAGREFGRAALPGTNDHLQQLAAELADYFAGRRQQFSVPLSFAGTTFQQRVWAELQKIPYGRTCCYADIARAIGNPRAVRAVGRANGQNRIAIVIPCHRVINRDGRPGGYAGGLRRKEFLLRLEQAQSGQGQLLR